MTAKAKHSESKEAARAEALLKRAAERLRKTRFMVAESMGALDLLLETGRHRRLRTLYLATLDVAADSRRLATDSFELADLRDRVQRARAGKRRRVMPWPDMGEATRKRLPRRERRAEAVIRYEDANS